MGSVAVLVLVDLDDSQIVVAVSRKQIVHEIQAYFLASRIHGVAAKEAQINSRSLRTSTLRFA
jgi:hypothetical protein